MAQVTLFWRVLVGFVVVLAGCAALLLGTAQLGTTRALDTARDRWQAQEIHHYRMVVQTDQGCLLDVEVRDEQTLRIFRNDNCTQPVRTVTELFSLVERGGERSFCSGYRCSCRMTLGTYADYDPQRGFPQRIFVRAAGIDNWLNQSYWQFLWNKGYFPSCDPASLVEMLSVQSFTPLN